MYILVQNKTGIVTKFSDICTESGRINSVVAYDNYTELNPILLGEYPTKERCQEVVLDILKAIRRRENTYEMPLE